MSKVVFLGESGWHTVDVNNFVPSTSIIMGGWERVISMGTPICSFTKINSALKEKKITHRLFELSSFCHSSSPLSVTLSYHITRDFGILLCISDVKYFTKSSKLLT